MTSGACHPTLPTPIPQPAVSVAVTRLPLLLLLEQLPFKLLWEDEPGVGVSVGVGVTRPLLLPRLLLRLICLPNPISEILVCFCVCVCSQKVGESPKCGHETMEECVRERSHDKRRGNGNGNNKELSVTCVVLLFYCCFRNNLKRSTTTKREPYGNRNLTCSSI
mmetsp:Transcript_1257/g.1281  ORF Transcript_1257/g.1281 Transcript_1257/m.1281 type:complete len:164 (+) Transcript_1257:83-574(+)